MSHLVLSPLQQDSPLLSQVTQLYLDAFPVCERRELEDWHYYMTPQAQRPFEVFVLMCDGDFTGFISCWNFDTFIYVEHFAVKADIRGKGIGQSTLEALKEHYNHRPIVLEVEVPEGEMPIRRIRFYERQGFHLSEQAYLQPPYREGEDWFELRLMTTHTDFLDANIQKVKECLYRQVYNVKTEIN